jgi:hypothetical protein
MTLMPWYGSPDATFRGRQTDESDTCHGICHLPAPFSIASTMPLVIVS